MPTRKTQTVRVVQKSERFNLTNTVGVAVVGAVVTLIGSGVMSNISLSADVAKLTADEARLEKDLTRHLDHSVDKDTYERRDRIVQKQLDDKASREEVTQLREEFKQQLIDLKDFVHTTQEALLPRGRR